MLITIIVYGTDYKEVRRFKTKLKWPIYQPPRVVTIAGEVYITMPRPNPLKCYPISVYEKLELPT